MTEKRAISSMYFRRASVRCVVLLTALSAALSTLLTSEGSAEELSIVKYNSPGLVVDLGVGLWAWPLPMDYDGDGDNDLIVSCPDKPYNGTYFFENVTGNTSLPVFKAGVRIGAGHHNVRVSHVDGEPRVLIPGKEFRDFRSRQLDSPVKLPVPANIHTKGHKIRANQWSYVDYDNDGQLDLMIGVGDWKDYGWDDAYNAQGEWTNGPLRGFVYLLPNVGTTASPKYGDPQRLQAGDADLEVFGWPSPNLQDFDGDGDLDLLCGEFLDKLTYFQNTGSRAEPQFAKGQRLQHNGQDIRMDLEMIVPSAIDWDHDGDIDLVVGDEDGRVALIEHTGQIENGVPQFLPPRYFQQQADELKFGALATPFGFDWDGDGDDDILSGNTAGYIGFFENLGGGEAPRWARVQYLKADDEVIRIQAGPNGSIQGPCEAKWGYTTLSVADWNHDDLPDVIVNSIWGKVVWYENVGTRQAPKLKAAQPIEVQWSGKTPKPAWTWWEPQGNELATQWRTTPEVVDWNGDGLNDLVMLDHEGYLAVFERRQTDSGLTLMPENRLFVDEEGETLQLNPGWAGKSGRRKIHVVDWDGDGRLDVLINSVNADLLWNAGTKDGKTTLKDLGAVGARRLAGHTSSPATVDWNRDGVPDLLIGAEDGHFYYRRHPQR